MSYEKVSDPWHELEGLPPSLESVRVRESIESSWRRILLDLRDVGYWLDTRLRLISGSIDRTFDSQVLEISEQVGGDPDDAGVTAYQMYSLISKVVRLELEPVFPVPKSFQALCGKLQEEITDALQASEPGDR